MGNRVDEPQVPDATEDVMVERATKSLLTDVDRPEMCHVHVWSKSGPLSSVYSCECGVVDVSTTGTRPS